MGNGMVIDLEHLNGEIKNLRDAGVSVTPENLKISDKAVICLPYHKLLDNLEEDRLGDAKFGSTRRGIAPVYGDKYMKRAVRMGELLHPEDLRRRLEGIVDWKNLTCRWRLSQRSHHRRRRDGMAGDLWRSPAGPRV